MIFHARRMGRSNIDCREQRFFYIHCKKLKQIGKLISVVAVVLLVYVHGEHLISCRDGQLT